MNKETNELLDSLLEQINNKQDLSTLSEALFKRGVETLLKAEMTAHLGHSPHEKGDAARNNRRNGSSSKRLKTKEGEVKIDVPRDRLSTFDPVTVRKHQTMTEELESVVIGLFARGMTTRDIVDFVEQNYGVQYSASQVSTITNSLLEEIEEWQTRPLQDQYAVLWIDAIHYKIRSDGKVISKANLVVMGIDMDGYQDILGFHIYEKESASVWMEMLEQLKARGLQDVLFICSDNLKGLADGVQAVFPESQSQICIVHQIRNTLKFVSYKDRKAVVKSIKAIYNADNEKAALKALDAFKIDWGDRYAVCIKSWEDNWANVSTFLHYPEQLRKLIYTTNIIESFNASLRKYTKNRRVFPNDNAAIKANYLAVMQISKKWKKRRFGWPQILHQLAILFPDRVKV